GVHQVISNGLERDPPEEQLREITGGDGGGSVVSLGAARDFHEGGGDDVEFARAVVYELEPFVVIDASDDERSRFAGESGSHTVDVEAEVIGQVPGQRPEDLRRRA